MKCTCPTQRPNARDPTQPIFHWLASGVGVGANANFKFCVGTKANLKGLRWLQDTNMLVSPTQKSGVGGIAQRQPRRQVFCIAVEYRLNSLLVCCRSLMSNQLLNALPRLPLGKDFMFLVLSLSCYNMVREVPPQTWRYHVLFLSPRCLQTSTFYGGNSVLLYFQ